MFSQMFKVTNTNYRNYLKASQNGIVRLDKDLTPQEFSGLCTDTLRCCIAIVIVSKGNKRLSLIHTDLGVEESAVVNEIKWVGEVEKVVLVKGIEHAQPDFEARTNFKDRTLPRLTNAILQHDDSLFIDIKSYPHPSWAVLVTREGQIQLIKEELALGQAAPDIEFRHAINMLNGYALNSQYKDHPLDLQYTGENWTNNPNVSSDAEQIIAAEYKRNNAFFLANANFIINAYMQYSLIREPEKNGKEFYKQRNYEAAIKCFLDALKTQLEDDKKALIFCNLGNSYFALKNYTAAVDSYTKAIQLGLGKSAYPWRAKAYRKQAELSTVESIKSDFLLKAVGDEVKLQELSANAVNEGYGSLRMGN
jgi:tetratricopeptide (TPR) repeat protein